MPKLNPPQADPTSLRIPPDLKRDLKRLAPLEPADVERRSMTWLILRILRQWVDWKKSKEKAK